MEDINYNLFRFRYEDIRKITGCIKPCTYLKYDISFNRPSMVDSTHFTFSVMVSILFMALNIFMRKILNIHLTFDQNGWIKLSETMKAGDNVTLVEQEELIYPLPSLVSFQQLIIKGLTFDVHSLVSLLALTIFRCSMPSATKRKKGRRHSDSKFWFLKPDL